MQTDKTQHAMESCVAHSLESLELIRTKLGVVPNLANLVTILTSLSDWQNLFAYNELSEQILVMRQIPGQRGNPNLHRNRPIRDDDITRVIVWLNRSAKMFRVAKGDVADAVLLASRENVISPIRHYFEGLERIPVNKAQNYLQEVAWKFSRELDISFILKNQNVPPTSFWSFCREHHLSSAQSHHTCSSSHPRWRRSTTSVVARTW